MKLEKWASIAEIACGFAIIVTLIILIVEVRGNTDAIRAQTLSTQRVAENQRRERVIAKVEISRSLFSRVTTGIVLRTLSVFG